MNEQPGFLEDSDCDIEVLRRLVERETRPEDVPRAADIVGRIPIYAGDSVAEMIAGPQRRALLTEWSRLLAAGPGVLAVRRLVEPTTVDRASAVFDRIMATERAANKGSGDHFAAAGANTRIWNAAQKHCERDSEGFVRYFGNAVLAAIAESWLGPDYQLTAQVNLVHPGGAAQTGHRDYHLGFMSAEQLRRFPAPVHRLSPLLTLQGAIAHCDMPIESGPTLLLPGSQAFLPGYLAVEMPAFQELFNSRSVQLPLQKGDGLFFNPALMHAAGSNQSADIERLANLLQISSAFGVPIETLDRENMARSIYPVLLELSGQLDAVDVDAAIAACAAGYPFPTNLDLDSPLSGKAPESQANLMRRALSEGWSARDFDAALLAQATRRLP